MCIPKLLPDPAFKTIFSGFLDFSWLYRLFISRNRLHSVDKVRIKPNPQFVQKRFRRLIFPTTSWAILSRLTRREYQMPLTSRSVIRSWASARHPGAFVLQVLEARKARGNTVEKAETVVVVCKGWVKKADSLNRTFKINYSWILGGQNKHFISINLYPYHFFRFLLYLFAQKRLDIWKWWDVWYV